MQSKGLSHRSKKIERQFNPYRMRIPIERWFMMKRLSADKPI